MSEPLMGFTSHIEGRNAKVAIYEDRIEWREGWRPAGGTKAAVMSMGLSLAVPGRRDTNMIPLRQVQGVTTYRAGLRTVVKVMTGADAIEFHVSRQQAEEIKALVTRLMLGGTATASTASSPTAAPVTDELAKLAHLRQTGALTDEEFAAQKAKLLGL